KLLFRQAMWYGLTSSKPAALARQLSGPCRLFFSATLQHDKMADTPCRAAEGNHLATGEVRRDGDGWTIAQEYRLGLGIDDSQRIDAALDDRVGAKPERLFRGDQRAERAWVVDAAFKRQHQHLERIRAAVAAGRGPVDHDDGTVVKRPVEQAGNHPLVLARPQRGEGEPLELATEHGAQASTGEAEDGLAAAVLFQDESVGEERLDVGRLDLRSLRRRSAIPEPVPVLEQGSRSLVPHCQCFPLSSPNAVPTWDKTSVHAVFHA